jgi:hypothetical protein
MAQQFAVSAEDGKKARIPHDILLVNLIFNHILVFVACLASTILLEYIFIVPILSVLLLSTIFIGAQRARVRLSNSGSGWYVSGHWQLCARRSLIFLVMLAILGAVFMLIYWLADGYLRPQHWALGGAASFPVMVAVLALIVMESEALNNAKAGVLPNWIRDRFPYNAAEPIAAEVEAIENKDIVKA